MRSFTDPPATGSELQPAPTASVFRRWNRKLHYYSGLFLLLFVWLFAMSGLLLNHAQWKFAEFWENRQQSTVERAITVPSAEGDLAQARDLVRQLGLRGEIDWTSGRSDARRLNFRVSHPGHIYEVKADFDRGTASVHHSDLNAWGVVRILHTFTGVRSGDSRNTRDWGLTTAWALAMDGVALGLIFMVFSSVVLWLESPQRRLGGAIALGLGATTCALFCFGLRLLY